MEFLTYLIERYGNQKGSDHPDPFKSEISSVVEHLFTKQRVVSSNLISRSMGFGVTGNTSVFGTEESGFEPLRPN